MYKYSPIKEIHIKNFRNIGEAKLDFEDSPIISLIGDNEAGKTSVVKAFAVCALHANSRDQKDYIRDGTNGFGVAIKLEDDTMVTRIKTPTVNSYKVEKPDGQVWETTKIDSGLPVAVSECMGLIEEAETKEFLQVRTYEDQLLFVTTTSSTNYKVMYDALKVDQLTKAIKVGSTEANALKASVNENETGIKTLYDNLRGVKVYDIEPVINIKNRLKNQLDIINKLEKANELGKQISALNKQLGALYLLDEYNVKEISIETAVNLSNSSRLITNMINCNNLLCKLKSLDTLQNIDTSNINRIESIINKKNYINELTAKASNLDLVHQLSEIDTEKVYKFNRVLDLRARLHNDTMAYNAIDITGAEMITQDMFNVVHKASQVIGYINKFNAISAEVSTLDYNIDILQNKLKESGAAVSSCPKCGETVIIDMSAYN